LRIAALAAVSTMVVAGCAPSQSSSTSGAATLAQCPTPSSRLDAAVTGLESKTGGRYKQGYELAVEQVNAAGAST
jgi:branched-chain amino acid transport system substrate-binding protein